MTGRQFEKLEFAVMNRVKPAPGRAVAAVLARIILFSALCVNARPQSTAAAQNPVLCVAVYDRGFDLSKVELSAGPVFVMILNRAHGGPLSFSLTFEDGTAVAAPSADRALSRWAGRVVLKPGTYSLREANHPTWLLTAVVSGSN